MLRFITYNCYNIKSSLQDIYELCKTYDVIFLQETWLFDFELSMLSNIHSEFEGVSYRKTDYKPIIYIYFMGDPMVGLLFYYVNQSGINHRYIFMMIVVCWV